MRAGRSIIVAIIVIGVILFQSLFVVQEISQAIVLQFGDPKKIVTKAIDYLGIKVSNYNNVITSLSGGNQQKVVIAKSLETEPRLLMLDEPTRGIDIGAKQEIFYIMKKLAEKGLSIIFVSSEIKEVLAVADRVIVLAKGKINKELMGGEITEDNLVKYSQG